MSKKSLSQVDYETLIAAAGAMQSLLPLTMAWTALYVVLRFGLFRKRTADFSNRIVSLVHAFVAIYMCARCLPHWGALLENVGGANAPEHLACMTLSLSYFVYDFIYCVFNNEVENVIHHMFTVGGLASGLMTGTSGPELVGCLFLMEVSNPCLHGRFILRELGMKESVLSTLNDLIFAMLFLICRLVIGPPLVWKTVMCKTNTYIVKAGGLGILVVSLLWGSKIVVMLTRAGKTLVFGKKPKKA